MAIGINPVSPLVGPSRKSRAQLPEPKAPNSGRTEEKDKVELSNAAHPVSGSSGLALQSIKDKISKGFYNSEFVMDDVSDKLANLFDRL